MQDNFADITHVAQVDPTIAPPALGEGCLLYTSDAADERSSVDLGGRRIIKKKTIYTHTGARTVDKTVFT